MQKNTAIKMVFLDLDGTLLQNVDTVSAHTKEILHKVRDMGVTPVICTGRLAYESDFAAKAIGASGYLIACNGAVVYSNYAEHKIIYEAYLESETVGKTISMLQKEQVFFQAYAGDRAYTPADRKAMITAGWDQEHADFFGKHMVLVENLEKFLENENVQVNKFMVGIPDHVNMTDLRKKLETIPGIVTCASGKNLLEVLPEKVDKRRAVRAIAAVEGLTREQIMVIGDSENDLGMFDEANICVAMGNACDQLKAKANYYAPSNKEDGAAWALENLLLGERKESFRGSISCISASDIEAAMKNSMRQYFTGDLKLPQTLEFLFDSEVESGISAYPSYRWEAAHYHTRANEYCYMIEGETRYVNLASNEEYTFRKGDFYILHHDTPYLQKSLPGCRLLFFKIPGLNDKVLVPMTEKMKDWCKSWENRWQTC